MLQYLRRSLYNWLKQEHHTEQLVEIRAPRDYATTDRMLSTRPLTFSLYRANGGWVVETRNHQDLNQHQGLRTVEDETRTKLHIIHNDNDLGEALGKIVFMENLQK